MSSLAPSLAPLSLTSLPVLVADPRSHTIEDVYEGRAGPASGSPRSKSGHGAPSSPSAHREGGVWQSYASPRRVTAAHGDSDALIPPRVLTLTPRSAEACLLEGIDPLELVPHDVEGEKGAPADILRLRKEAFEAARAMKMEAVRAARAQLIAAEERGARVRHRPIPVPPKAVLASSSLRRSSSVSAPAGARGSRSSMGSRGNAASRSGGDALSYTGSSGSSTGAHALERMAAKQAREMEAMMAFETRMAQIAAEADARAAADAAAKREADARALARQRAAVQVAHAREEAKRVKEAAAAARSRAAAREFYESEMARKAEHEAAVRAAAKQRAAAQQQAQARREAFRAGTEARLRAQADVVDARAAAMAERDQLRREHQQQMEEERRLAAAAKREEIEHRLAYNLECAAALEQARLDAIAAKDEVAALKRFEREEHEEAWRRARAAAADEAAAARERVLTHAHETEEERRQFILTRRAGIDAHLAEIRAQREHEAALARERARLEQIQKAEAVARTRRKAEYRTLTIMRGVAARAERVAALEAERHRVKAEVRERAYTLTQQRAAILTAFDKAKRTKRMSTMPTLAPLPPAGTTRSAPRVRSSSTSHAHATSSAGVANVSTMADPGHVRAPVLARMMIDTHMRPQLPATKDAHGETVVLADLQQLREAAVAARQHSDAVTRALLASSTAGPNEHGEQQHDEGVDKQYDTAEELSE